MYSDEPALATMCYENELFILEAQAIHPRMIPREISNRHITQQQALQLMTVQQRKQQKHPASIRAQLQIKIDNEEEEFDRKSYLNQLFRKFIEGIHWRQGAQMFFDVTDPELLILNYWLVHVIRKLMKLVNMCYWIVLCIKRSD
jgi:hypothetical protein